MRAAECLPSCVLTSIVLASACSRRCGQLHLCSTESLTDQFAQRAADAGLLRPKALVYQDTGTLWDGPQPRQDRSPLDVISLTLSALQSNDEPQPNSGTALLRRFAWPDFVLAGEANELGGSLVTRLTPQELSAFFRKSQYGLLLEPNGYVACFPSDCVSLDEEHAWQEVTFEDLATGDMLVKAGWELRRRADGCWLTYSVSWHDFRDGFRPGIDQVEWDRSFG